jgi:hypothetical protein
MSLRRSVNRARSRSRELSLWRRRLAEVADAEKAQLEVNPVPGDELQKLVAEIYKTPPEVAKKAGALLAVK